MSRSDPVARCGFRSTPRDVFNLVGARDVWTDPDSGNPFVTRDGMADVLASHGILVPKEWNAKNLRCWICGTLEYVQPTGAPSNECYLLCDKALHDEYYEWVDDQEGTGLGEILPDEEYIEKVHLRKPRNGRVRPGRLRR